MLDDDRFYERLVRAVALIMYVEDVLQSISPKTFGQTFMAYTNRIEFLEICIEIKNREC